MFCLSSLLFVVPDLLALLPAFEEQLVASCHEMEEARLQEVLLMEDNERAVVARIRQGGQCHSRRLAASHRPKIPSGGA
jgi:competence protein ComGF